MKIFGQSQSQPIPVKSMDIKGKSAVPSREAVAKIPKIPKKKEALIIIEAPEDQCFWVNDGPVLRNLYDLGEALETMTDEQYSYHTKRDGNDFALWVENVLGDKELAKKMTRVKTRQTAASTLKKYLA